MPELAVVIVARESEQRSVLQLLVDGTRVARAAQSFGSIPLASTDPLVRRIRDEHPDVVLLDIPSSDPTSAVRVEPHSRPDAEDPDAREVGAGSGLPLPERQVGDLVPGRGEAPRQLPVPALGAADRVGIQTVVDEADPQPR